MELAPGESLINRYRVIRLLGQGGMGAVYYAHDPVLNRYVAIKQLQPDPITGAMAAEQVRKQFLREAQSLAALHHPNLPRVTDYFIQDDLHYLVMDYIEGQSLLEIVQANKSGLPEDQVLDWADQILGALEYIHHNSLIHRDIKPANLRRTPDGRIFLVDFGLVKPYDPGDPKTMTMFHGVGTLEYSPPEQYDAQTHTDQRSDIYSLGATLYHLLSGQVPASLTRRISDPASLQPAHATNTSVSPEVERVIMRAMELERSKRFVNATEMRAALRAARGYVIPEDGATTKLPAAPIALPERRSRRVLAWAAVPAALILLALAGVATQAGLNGGTPTPTPTLTPTGTNTDEPTPTPTLTLTPTPTSTEAITATVTLTSTLRRTVFPTVTPAVSPQSGTGSGGTSGGSGSTTVSAPKGPTTAPGQIKQATQTSGGGGSSGGSSHGGGKPQPKK